MSGLICKECNEPIVHWGTWVTYGMCMDCWGRKDMDRFKEYDKAPAGTEGIECNYSVRNHETGQYEQVKRKTLSTVHRSHLDATADRVAGILGQCLAPRDKSKQEPEPQQPQPDPDTEDR